ncbi:MAG: peptidase M56, partial [Lawsonibacter sp.]|nr:peptidase M56 [Lawsonibacter sp.]
MTQWTVSSAALILIVLAVRYLFRDRLSARLRYALWGVVLLRLLVPFQVELPAPVSDALPVLASNLAPEVGQWEEPSIPVFPERSKPVAEF